MSQKNADIKLKIAVEALKKIRRLGHECGQIEFNSEHDIELFMSSQFCLALGIVYGALTEVRDRDE